MSDEEHQKWERRIRATVMSLRSECDSNKYRVAGDGAVSEPVAAKLLGYSSGDTLRKQVQAGTCRLRYWQTGNRRRYRLSDIAEEIEKTYR